MVRSTSLHLVLLACLAAGTHAFLVQPAQLARSRPAPASRTSAPAMVVPPMVDETLSTAVAALPSTVMLSDVMDAVAGFAGSPLILLVPIGAGTLVACGIIFVLVKAAG